VIELEPGLESEDLKGAMIFYDYQMYSPERLALECVMSAVEAGADAANYVEVLDFIVKDDQITGVRARDALNTKEDEVIAFSGRVVVNAAGPWADILMRVLQQNAGRESDPQRHLIRSKGIHLLTRQITNGHAIAVVADSSHFFILPWRGYSLLGTTDTVYKGDPDKVHVTEKDIVDFLAVVNKGYPGAKLLRSDVVYFYSGLRPIVDTSSRDKAEPAEPEGGEEQDTYKASRASEVYDHEVEEGIKGIITAIGGKWTTSRHLAEHVVDLILVKMDREPVACLTTQKPTYGGDVGGRFNEFKKTMLQQYADLPGPVMENIIKNYGSRAQDVLALVKDNPQLAEKLSSKQPEIAAQVLYAVRDEMALTVEDVLFRRTGLGTTGSPGDAAIDRVGKIMAAELKWTEPQRQAIMARAVAKFTSWARTRAIVNPHSMGDRTGTLWPEIQAKVARAIGPVEAVFTDGPMAAKRLTRQALKEGMEQIIAVGGDGTINEVINGFFENGQLINPEAVLAVLTSGTGRDFRRTFEIPENVNEQIDRMAASEIRAIDLGSLTYTTADGGEDHRLFGNIASFGLSGATDQAVNNLKFAKRLGGRFAFKWGMIKALLWYRNQLVRIQVDDTFDQIVNVTTAAVCNGQYFGSGMRIAPNASPHDGVFDIIIVADTGKIELVQKMNAIYQGEHLEFEQVTALRGKKVIATPVEGAKPLLLDVDGEAPGTLPATFEIIPQAIFFRG
jgi:glycerol-3-phosphate dehydrogenase